MTETVTDSDLRRLFGVIDAARSPDGGEGLPVAALETLSGLVACDTISFFEFEASTRTVVADTSVNEPDLAEDAVDLGAFWRHYWDCLPCSYPERSHDERSITTISDFYSRRQYHATGMYAEYLRAYDTEQEALMCLSAPAGHQRRILFFRSGRTDFDGRDRMLLTLLRPHLSEVCEDLERRRSPAARLTPRQHELVVLVARGYSNAQIARALAISPGTVRKHLENIFERLSVPSRAAAAALVAASPVR